MIIVAVTVNEAIPDGACYPSRTLDCTTQDDQFLLKFKKRKKKKVEMRRTTVSGTAEALPRILVKAFIER